MNVILFGASGMLGHTVADFLYKHRQEYSKLTFTVKEEKQEKFQNRWQEANIIPFNVAIDSTIPVLRGHDYAINCIGMINKLIDENNEDSVRRAKLINTSFPNWLAAAGELTNTKILHISTDCVYSGKRGGYGELDKHDATDIYGKTKSEGESENENMKIIRCSIIGPELDTKYGLFEWFMSQQRGDLVNAFTNHFWNGVTTRTFAKLCHAVITNDFDLPHIHHFVPLEAISKADLLTQLSIIYKHYPSIKFVEAPETIDRSLTTVHKALNEYLWQKMGYSEIPPIVQLLQEMYNEV